MPLSELRPQGAVDTDVNCPVVMSISIIGHSVNWFIDVEVTLSAQYQGVRIVISKATAST